VYIGFDQPHSLGRRETGASVAAPAFREFMTDALKDKPAIPFRIPPGLDMVRIDPDSGRLARADDRKAIYMAYKPGTEPTAAGPGMVVSGQELEGVAPADASGSTPSQNATQPVPGSGTGGLY
ncbi:MAG TPA: penicillin-binding protein, partial [Stellaceae bacterium]|nr:penicillin-binding protein [Stellaceae bacterium]